MPEFPPHLDALAGRLFPLDVEPADPNGPFREAGVLVLLFPRENETRFILTARPETLRRHAGQISLPGGRREVEDASLWETALRETREELGLDVGTITPLGRLNDVDVSVSGYRISPFVAWRPSPPLMRPDPEEVARVIEVPVSLLLDPGAIGEEEWEFRGSRWIVTFYRVGELIVWGATARILNDLAERIRGGSVEGSAPGSVREAVSHEP